MDHLALPAPVQLHNAAKLIFTRGRFKEKCTKIIGMKYQYLKDQEQKKCSILQKTTKKKI